MSVSAVADAGPASQRRKLLGYGAEAVPLVQRIAWNDAYRNEERRKVGGV